MNKVADVKLTIDEYITSVGQTNDGLVIATSSGRAFYVDKNVEPLEVIEIIPDFKAQQEKED